MQPSSRGGVGRHGCLNHVVALYHYLLDSVICLVGYIVMMSVVSNNLDICTVLVVFKGNISVKIK